MLESQPLLFSTVVATIANATAVSSAIIAPVDCYFSTQRFYLLYGCFQHSQCDAGEGSASNERQRQSLLSCLRGQIRQASTSCNLAGAY